MTVRLVEVDTIGTWVYDCVRSVAAGGTVLLDESVECLALARELALRPGLRVVTTGLDALAVLAGSLDLDVIVPPGQMDRTTRSVVLLTESLRLPFTVEHGFFGASSYSTGGGPMERDPTLAATKRALASACALASVAVTAATLDTFGPYSFLKPDSPRIRSVTAYGPKPAAMTLVLPFPDSPSKNPPVRPRTTPPLQEQPISQFAN